MRCVEVMGCESVWGSGVKLSKINFFDLHFDNRTGLQLSPFHMTRRNSLSGFSIKGRTNAPECKTIKNSPFLSFASAEIKMMTNITSDQLSFLVLCVQNMGGKINFGGVARDYETIHHEKLTANAASKRFARLMEKMEKIGVGKVTNGSVSPKKRKDREDERESESPKEKKVKKEASVKKEVKTEEKAVGME